MAKNSGVEGYFGLLLLISILQLASVADASVYTSFLPQLIRCKSAEDIVYPMDLLPSLQNIVREALRSNGTVKPIGALHSGTDVICTHGTPVEMTGIRHFSYDNKTGLVTVGAGIRLLDLLERLHEVGRTIEAVPTYGDITIGGALGTGSHGTGLNHPVSVSDLVVSLVVVDGLGNVRRVNDSRTLRAFRTNLGLLGIIYEVTMKTVPQFKLEIKHELVDDSILLNHRSQAVLKLARSLYRFQLWWFPTARSVVLSKGRKVSVETKGDCKTHFIPDVSKSQSQRFSQLVENVQSHRGRMNMYVLQDMAMLSLIIKTPFRSPIFEDNEGQNECVRGAIGYSHRMQTNRCTVCGWDHGEVFPTIQEFSVAVPIEEFDGAVATIQSIIKEYPVDFPLSGIYIRFLSESDGLLNINGERKESVVFEWVMVLRQNRFKQAHLGMPASQAMMQALIYKHNGRPHWSKNGLYYFNNNLTEKRYPHFQEFLNYVKEFDPFGVFRNDFSSRLLGESWKTPIDEEAKHCALVENCICSRDDDCSSPGIGNLGGWGDDSRPYVCGYLQGHRVCREQRSNEILERYQQFLSTLGTEIWRNLLFSRRRA